MHKNGLDLHKKFVELSVCNNKVDGIAYSSAKTKTVQLSLYVYKNKSKYIDTL